MLPASPLNTTRRKGLPVMSEPIYRRTIIYKVTNLVNGKIYIGTTTKHLENRKQQHHIDSNQPKMVFSRALRKYGFESFEWEIIDESFNPKYAFKILETHYIQKLHSHLPSIGYNTSLGGDCVMLNRKHSEESKRKNSESHKGKKASIETRQKMSRAHQNRISRPHSKESKQKMSEIAKRRPPVSEETKRKMSKSHTGKKRKPFSQEHRKNLSKAAKKRWAKA